MIAETIELAIHDVAYGGRGVGRHGNLAVFVPGTLPGETVRARVTGRHRRHADARLLEILNASPDRVTPGCPLAEAELSPSSRCAGCCYRHAGYPAELRFKQKQLTDLLTRIGRVVEPDIVHPVASPLVSGYRNKITLHVARRAGATLLGYVSADNRTLVDVDRCPLAHAELNSALAALRADPPPEVRHARSLTLRYTEPDGPIHWFDRPAGQARLTEHTSLGAIDVPRNCFFQVNPGVMELLLQELLRHVRDIAPECVVDLYCGVGVFALAAAMHGLSSVCGIDSNTRAIRAARRNAKTRGLDVPFFADKAAKALGELAPHIDADRTVVIVDPPRKGLDPDVIAALGAVRPAHLLYVSCAPDTLARDIARLAAPGYRLVRTKLFDMFPRTAAFESVSLVCRV